MSKALHKPAHRLTLLGALVVLVYMVQVNPPAGLAVMGGAACLVSVIILRSRQQIWDNYKKSYSKSKNPALELLHRPLRIYYLINVLVVWPLLFMLGLIAMYTAWQLVY